jgi:hypothetical protein
MRVSEGCPLGCVITDVPHFTTTRREVRRREREGEGSLTLTALLMPEITEITENTEITRKGAQGGARGEFGGSESEGWAGERLGLDVLCVYTFGSVEGGFWPRRRGGAVQHAKLPQSVAAPARARTGLPGSPSCRGVHNERILRRTTAARYPVLVVKTGNITLENASISDQVGSQAGSSGGSRAPGI